MNALDGRVVFVTGGGSGIGRAISEELAARGARVTIADLDGDRATDVARSLDEAEATEVDVTSRASLEAACDAVYARHGRVDVVVANAGVSTMNRFLELNDEEWDSNFAVNAKGAFLTMQTFARRMVDQPSIPGSELRGKLVATASMAGRAAAPLLAHYSASKFAVVGLVQAVAKELGHLGVTVNGVNPGFVETSMQARELSWEARLRGMEPREVRDEYIAQTPLGRIQNPRDVARAVAFLASPDADFITGELLEVNGGAYMT